jgi:hypothetical protein
MCDNRRFTGFEDVFIFVIPAKAGIQLPIFGMDPRVKPEDDERGDGYEIASNNSSIE